mmetsp:Transcript_2243/g.273  ORF Transcript_2243/g.273 Transcript_2243/m.273 type:complete len:86 (+) Transcript_2243:37-294(+)
MQKYTISIYRAEEKDSLILKVILNSAQLISDLKQNISKITHVPSNRQRLTYYNINTNVLLSEGWPCSFYNLHNAKIFLEVLNKEE